ncbi:hypothetical protein A4X09_0g2192 [Tilletia walkeri]|uniref:Uncharacterized protein n=1 Tax=Tilletia walkeri TaxID=117179 RepID=A0A8X7NA98_9BASI|nr:hypothetical protein A4X09_0g2192 [Tilletia walkeri]
MWLSSTHRTPAKSKLSTSSQYDSPNGLMTPPASQSPPSDQERSRTDRQSPVQAQELSDSSSSHSSTAHGKRSRTDSFSTRQASQGSNTMNATTQSPNPRHRKSVRQIPTTPKRGGGASTNGETPRSGLVHRTSYDDDETDRRRSSPSKRSVYAAPIPGVGLSPFKSVLSQPGMAKNGPQITHFMRPLYSSARPGDATGDAISFTPTKIRAKELQFAILAGNTSSDSSGSASHDTSNSTESAGDANLSMTRSASQQSTAEEKSRKKAARSSSTTRNGARSSVAAPAKGKQLSRRSTFGRAHSWATFSTPPPARGMRVTKEVAQPVSPSDDPLLLYASHCAEWDYGTGSPSFSRSRVLKDVSVGDWTTRNEVGIMTDRDRVECGIATLPEEDEEEEQEGDTGGDNGAAGTSFLRTQSMFEPIDFGPNEDEEPYWQPGQVDADSDDEPNNFDSSAAANVFQSGPAQDESDPADDEPECDWQLGDGSSQGGVSDTVAQIEGSTAQISISDEPNFSNPGQDVSIAEMEEEEEEHGSIGSDDDGDESPVGDQSTSSSDSIQSGLTQNTSRSIADETQAEDSEEEEEEVEQDNSLRSDSRSQSQDVDVEDSRNIASEEPVQSGHADGMDEEEEEVEEEEDQDEEEEEDSVEEDEVEQDIGLQSDSRSQSGDADVEDSHSTAPEQGDLSERIEEQQEEQTGDVSMASVDDLPVPLTQTPIRNAVSSERTGGSHSSEAEQAEQTDDSSMASDDDLPGPPTESPRRNSVPNMLPTASPFISYPAISTPYGPRATSSSTHFEAATSPNRLIRRLGDDGASPGTLQRANSSASLLLMKSSEQPVIQISSLDPRAAAKAAAILKLHYQYVEEGFSHEEVDAIELKKYGLSVRDIHGLSAQDVSDLPNVLADEELKELERQRARSTRARHRQSAVASPFFKSGKGSAKSPYDPDWTLSGSSDSDKLTPPLTPAAEQRDSKDVQFGKSPRTPRLPGAWIWTPAKLPQSVGKGKAVDHDRRSPVKGANQGTPRLNPDPLVWELPEWSALDRVFRRRVREDAVRLLDASELVSNSNSRSLAASSSSSLSSSGLARLQIEGGTDSDTTRKIKAHCLAVVEVDVENVFKIFVQKHNIQDSQLNGLWSSHRFATRIAALQRRYLDRVDKHYRSKQVGQSQLDLIALAYTELSAMHEPLNEANRSAEREGVLRLNAAELNVDPSKIAMAAAGPARGSSAMLPSEDSMDFSLAMGGGGSSSLMLSNGRGRGGMLHSTPVIRRSGELAGPRTLSTKAPAPSSLVAGGAKDLRRAVLERISGNNLDEAGPAPMADLKNNVNMTPAQRLRSRLAANQ